jgi:carbon-monoxide dehydrogenase small subunit
MKHQLSLTVNGELYEVQVEAETTLLDLIRDSLGLTGTKKGCNEGDCGACTVLMDGEPVNSCMLLAVEADGREVITIEGIARGRELHPLQKAFVEKGAVQCGYCTPGMVLAAKSLLDENSQPTEEEIRHALSGNLCRCTGYAKIVEAVKAAAAELSNLKAGDSSEWIIFQTQLKAE